MKKLTMISVNGKVRFVRTPVSKDGRVRVQMKTLDKLFGLKRGSCLCIG